MNRSVYPNTKSQAKSMEDNAEPCKQPQRHGSHPKQQKLTALTRSAEQPAVLVA